MRDPRIEHGRWRKQLLVVGATAAVVLLVVLVVDLACGDDSDEGKLESRHTKIVRLQNEDVVSLPSLAIPRLELAGEHDIVEGQFLTTEPGRNAPEGFLLKALSASQISTTEDGDEETTVETRPASLFEAEPAGELVANPSDFEAEGAGLVPPVTEPVRSEPEVVTAALRVGAIEDSFLWPLLKDQVKVKCEGKAGFPDFKPEMKLHLEPNFDLRWNRAKWLKRRIETADASIEATLSLTVQGAASAGFGCELVPQRGVPIFFIAVPVGPVPVPVRVEATGALKAEATVATDKDDHLKVDLNASTGIEYDGEQVKARMPRLEEIEASLGKASLRLPEFDPQATVGFRVKPGLAIEAGWRIPALGKTAAVAEMKLGTGVDLRYDHEARSEAKPRLRACVPLELQGGFFFHLPGKRWHKESEPRALKEKCVSVGGGRKGEEGEGEPTPEAGG